MNNNRIAKAFQSGKAFIGLLTGGDPSIEKTAEYILRMIEGGADLIEIGIPFSDPIAEGSIVQEANIRALQGNCDPDQLLELVAKLRLSTQVPIVFLSYLNPVFVYGYDKFFAKCSKCGVDGIVIQDLPFEEQGEVRIVAEAHGVSLIPIIAPAPQKRIQEIAVSASGFLHAVSSAQLPDIIAAAKAVTDIPIVAGFGVYTPAQATAAAQYADGVIAESEIVKLIGQHGKNAADAVYNYVRQMKQAMLY